MNITDYLDWRGDLTFAADPVNTADALILSQLSYIDFDTIVPDKLEDESITLSEAAKAYEEAHPDIVSDKNVYELFRECAQLLSALAKTVRFRDVRLLGARREISQKREYQFAAITADITENERYVSFSGTDDSITGWKEDFNLCYLSETPGQKRSAEYLCEALQKSGQKRIIVGGHSKGGNFAVFAATQLPAKMRDKLTAVYNFDGPGLTQKSLDEQNYRAIQDKIHTYLPESSVIGLLMDHSDSYSVVKSSAKGFMQHDMFSWQILGKVPVCVPSLSKESLVLDKALKKWIDKMDDQTRRQFVDSLFSVLEKENIEDIESLGHLNPKQIIELIKIISDMETDDKDTVVGVLKSLLNSYLEAHKEVKHTTEAPEETLPDTDEE